MIIFNHIFLVIAFSFSALQAKGLENINENWPHARDFIANIIKNRGVDPENFEVIFSPEKKCSLIQSVRNFLFPFNYSDNTFSMCYYLKKSNSDPTNKGKYRIGISRKDLSILEMLVGSKDSISISVHIKLFMMGLTSSQFQDIFTFFVGHELQHHFDIHKLSLDERFKKESFEEKSLLTIGREMEIQADKCASIDPKILSAGAVFFEKVYESNKEGYDYAYSSERNEESLVHPHPLERAKYLLIAANAQKVINKKFNSAFSCLIKKRREKKAARKSL
jgi:hypothetical protein